MPAISRCSRRSRWGAASCWWCFRPATGWRRDLLLYKRTDKYIRQNLTTAQVESLRRILMEKQAQNTQRQVRLRTLLVELGTQAMLVVDGQELAIGGSEPRRAS